MPNSGMWKGSIILGWLHLFLEKEVSAWLIIKTRISCGFLNPAEFEDYFPLTWLIFKWKFSKKYLYFKVPILFCLVPDGELGTTTPSLRFSKTCLKNVFSVILLFIYLLLMAVAVFLVYQTISDFREKLKHPVMSVTYKEVSLYDAPGKSGNKQNGLSSCLWIFFGLFYIFGVHSPEPRVHIIPWPRSFISSLFNLKLCWLCIEMLTL